MPRSLPRNIHDIVWPQKLDAHFIHSNVSVLLSLMVSEGQRMTNSILTDNSLLFRRREMFPWAWLTGVTSPETSVGRKHETMLVFLSLRVYSPVHRNPNERESACISQPFGTVHMSFPTQEVPLSFNLLISTPCSLCMNAPFVPCIAHVGPLWTEASLKVPRLPAGVCLSFDAF